MCIRDRVNQQRGKSDPEYELLDSGVFEHNQYFDLYVEYAKNDSTDIMIRITVINRGADAAELTVIPTLWFRNEWSFDPDAVKPLSLIHISEPTRLLSISYA